MYEYFHEEFNEFLIEDNNNYLIYLISGEKLKHVFKWYGVERAKAFNALSTKSMSTDIEERDNFFTHMLLWDKETKELVGGQRFLYSRKGSLENKNFSYLEYYHPGTYINLKNTSFCEIGRTFIMPKFQNKNILIEFIRGFVKIPESEGIQIGLGLISFNDKELNKLAVNTFIKYLENSNSESLNLPKGKYQLNELKIKKDITYIDYTFEHQNLKKVEQEIKKLDSKFKLPPVLKPYIKYCGLKYEGYSIAKDYNGIIQLLFSGIYQNIKNYPMKNFKSFQII